MPHTVMNKIVGFLLFLLPLTLAFADIKYTGFSVCTFAAVSAADEFFRVLNGKGIE